MANCTYRFTDQDGKERVIEGQAAFKAYLASGGLEHLLPGPKVAFSGKQGEDLNTRLQQKIFSDFDAAVREYSALPATKNGKLLDTDQARELSPEYRADRSLAPKVHEAASAFTQRVFETRMADSPDGGLVMFMAGGGGAGKSSAEYLLGAEMDRAGTILDGTLSSYDKAARNVQLALDNNQSVIIAYVYREPVEAMRNGVLPPEGIELPDSDWIAAANRVKPGSATCGVFNPPISFPSASTCGTRIGNGAPSLGGS